MEQRGQLFTAMLDYAESGSVPDFADPLLRLAWGFVVPSLDADNDRYQAVCGSGKYAKYCGDVKKQGIPPLTFDEWREAGSPSARDWISRQRSSTTVNDRQPPSNARQRAAPISVSISDSDSIPVSGSVSGAVAPPPTLQEVTGYCQEAGLKIDTQRFYDHYTAVGWMVGKSPVADWKALCRRWAGEDAKRASKGGLEVDYGEDQFFSS